MKILNSYKPELNNLPGNPLKKFSQTDGHIFLLRHGQIKGAENKKFVGRTDIHLDNAGILQAYYWKEVFSFLDLKTVYSSSLARCLHTAGLIAGPKKIIIDSNLNEINMGAWDGMSFDNIKKQYPDDFIYRGNCIDTFKAPGGESFYDLSCRVIPFFNHVYNTTSTNTLIVTHAGVIRIILCDILKMELKDLFKIKIDYGQLFVIKT